MLINQNIIIEFTAQLLLLHDLKQNRIAVTKFERNQIPLNHIKNNLSLQTAAMNNRDAAEVSAMREKREQEEGGRLLLKQIINGQYETTRC
jgi:hypothetical protein